MTRRSKLTLSRVFAALLGLFGLLYLMGLGRDYPIISIGFYALAVAVVGYMVWAVLRGRNAGPHLRWRRLLFMSAVAVAVLFAISVWANLFVY